jgi:iron-sulfur cluster repair protein YtfE (RIC family)
MVDPIRELSHDHAEINRNVLALGAILRDHDPRSEPSRELVAHVGVLRELLFTHFAREEEGLFPFVVEVIPELAARVHEMEVAHDTICGALARVHALGSANAAVAPIIALFHRFETAYADHANTEAALLRSLDGRLDAVLRTRLAALVEGL